MPTTSEVIGPIVSVEVQFNPPTWTDVTSDVKSIETKRGANRIQQPVLRSQAGTGHVVLSNNNRQYDPTNLSGPHVSGGESLVVPMRQVRIRGTYNAITYGIMRAFVDSWDLAWNGPNWSQVSVPFTDAFKVLESFNRLPVDPTVGAGENSGARITRILDSVGWPIADRDIGVGNSLLQATNLEGSALSECFLVADSELGEFYVDGDGNVTFRNRQAILTETRSNTVQAIFGDGPGELQYAHNGLTLSYDHETLANLVQISREGGNTQSVSDSASVSKYLTRTFNRSNLLLENDSAALSYAQWVLYTSKDPELRFDSIVINPLKNPSALMPQVLARELGDRIRIVRRPPGGGSAITRDVFIRGISHAITPSSWKTTWSLQSASKYGSYFVLDNTILGKLNENALGF